MPRIPELTVEWLRPQDLVRVNVVAAEPGRAYVPERAVVRPEARGLAWSGVTNFVFGAPRLQFQERMDAGASGVLYRVVRRAP